jgi:hypothetical protein
MTCDYLNVLTGRRSGRLASSCKLAVSLILLTGTSSHIAGTMRGATIVIRRNRDRETGPAESSGNRRQHLLFGVVLTPSLALREICHAPVEADGTSYDG